MAKRPSAGAQAPSAPRPLMNLDAEQLLREGMAAHHRGDQDHLRECLRELEHRSTSRAAEVEEELAALLGDRSPPTGQPPPQPGFQGRAEHQQLQDALCQLGQIRGLIVKTNCSIGGGFRPDVLWYKLSPDEHPQAGAHAVFEIEFGEAAALSKSLASLKHAHDLWGGVKLYLFVPKRNRPRVDSRLGMVSGAFHEIRKHLTVISTEECSADLRGLWKLLALD